MHAEPSEQDYESEDNSSRKLPRAVPHDSNAHDAAGDSGGDSGAEEERPKHSNASRNGFTYDPLFKAKAAARAAAASKREAAAAATQKDKEVAKKQKARRAKSRQYAKRSSKGQPLMATRMKDLLGKIQQRSGQ